MCQALGDEGVLQGVAYGGLGRRIVGMLLRQQLCQLSHRARLPVEQLEETVRAGGALPLCLASNPLDGTRLLCASCCLGRSLLRLGLGDGCFCTSCCRYGCRLCFLDVGGRRLWRGSFVAGSCSEVLLEVFELRLEPLEVVDLFRDALQLGSYVFGEFRV
ncbi:hypothetical protein STRMOE7_00195 [Streptomyces sp. MOE7]|nr:hypothetical protein STRMOE7_00195 [Streptomyces sp. MOE7]